MRARPRRARVPDRREDRAPARRGRSRRRRSDVLERRAAQGVRARRPDRPLQPGRPRAARRRSSELLQTKVGSLHGLEPDRRPAHLARAASSCGRTPETSTRRSSRSSSACAICCSTSAPPREHRSPQLHRARPQRGSLSRRRTRRRGDRPRRRGERAGGRGGGGVRDRRHAAGRGRPRPGRRVPHRTDAPDAALRHAGDPTRRRGRRDGPRADGARRRGPARPRARRARPADRRQGPAPARRALRAGRGPSSEPARRGLRSSAGSHSACVRSTR